MKDVATEEEALTELALHMTSPVNERGREVMAISDAVAESSAITPTATTFEMMGVAEHGAHETIKDLGIWQIADTIAERTCLVQKAA